MADTIDAVIAALEAEGSPTQVQWADNQVSWGEGAIIVSRDGDALVVTQLGRVEAEDRAERFESEEAAADQLRDRLVGHPVRHRTPEERAADRERMKARAERIKDELDAGRSES